MVAAFVVDKAVDGIKSMVTAASDLQQSTGATQAIFGKTSKRIISDSGKMAKAVGLSSNAYLESMNLIGSLGVNQGLNATKAAAESQKLIKVGSDLAAVFGGQVKDATEALGSAYKGEFDPMQRYGVTLTQNMINTQAMADANVASTSAFNKLSTAQQTYFKHLATTQLVEKQTAKTHGQFAKQTNTLAEQQQILAAQFDNVKAKVGTLLLPVITKFVSYLNNKGVPLLDRLAKWLKVNQAAIADNAKAWGTTLLSALQTTWRVLEPLGQFIIELPGPVRKLGIEVGIAAIAFNKIRPAVDAVSTALATFSTQLGTSEGRSKAVSTGIAKVGQAAKTAAGVGGMTLLIDGFSKADTAAGDFETAIGGALAGFSVGGPWGAAIGLAVGGLAGFVRANKHAVSAGTDPLRKANLQLADSFDAITNKATDATRALVVNDLQKKNLLGDVTRAGLTQKTYVDAVMGDPDAARKVVKKVQDIIQHPPAANAPDWMQAQYESALNLDVALKPLEKRFDSEREKAQQATLANRGFIGSLKGIPANVATEIKATGLDGTMDNVKRLTIAYNLTPKQIKTVMHADGIDATKANLKQLQAQIARTPKNVRTVVALSGPDANIKTLKKYAKQVSLTPKEARTLLKVEGLDVSKKNIGSLATYAKTTGAKTGSNLTSSAVTAITNGRAKVQGAVTGLVHNAGTGGAYDKGHGIGGYLGSGISVGISSQTPFIVSTVNQLIDRAIAAANARAKIHSPSRRTMATGRFLSDGLAVGIQQHARKPADAMNNVMDGVLARASTHKTKTVSVGKAFDWVAKWVRGGFESAFKSGGIGSFLKSFRQRLVKAFDNAGQSHKDATKSASRVMDGFDKSTKKLKQVAARYKAVTAQLGAATKGLAAAQAVQAKAQGAFDSASSAVTNFGQVTNTNSAFNGSAIKQAMQAKVAQAGQFYNYLKQLVAMHLNATTLQDLANAGPDGGLAYAQALVQGGKSIVSAVNTSQGQIASLANQTGQLLAQSVSGKTTTAANAAVAAANTLVDTLTAKQKDLAKIGDNIADGLVNGLNTKVKKISDAANKIGDAIAKAIKKALGIKSPSRVMAEVGRYTVAGLAVGLGDATQLRAVRSAASGMSDAIVAGYNPPAVSAPSGGRGGDVIQINVKADPLTDQRALIKNLAQGLDAHYQAKGKRISLVTI